jgi:membrane dipeptidase
MIFDGHTDILTDLTQQRLSGNTTSLLQDVHMKKMEQGQIGGGIFVVWPDPPFDSNPYKRTQEILETLRLEMDVNHPNIQWIKTAADIDMGLADNKFLLMVGFEGLASIGTNIDLLDTYYQIGGRHASLTWNDQNDLATGWNGDCDRGLTNHGKRAIKKLEDLKMIVDVSHANDTSFWDIAKVVTRPIIASHSNCRSLCGNRRNLTDEQLKFIQSTGGLVGLNAFKEFVHDDSIKQDLNHLANHIDHMVQVIGIDHVVCGFDFCDFLATDTLGSFASDGVAATINFEDATKAHALLDELERRGYSQTDIDQIAYKNYMKFLKEML